MFFGVGGHLRMQNRQIAQELDLALKRRPGIVITTKFSLNAAHRVQHVGRLIAQRGIVFRLQQQGLVKLQRIAKKRLSERMGQRHIVQSVTPDAEKHLVDGLASSDQCRVFFGQCRRLCRRFARGPYRLPRRHGGA